MKKTTLSVLINFLIFVIYYCVIFFRAWGESGGDLGIMLFSLIGLIAQLLILTPIISFLLERDKFLKTYLFGTAGIFLGVIAGFLILLIGYQVLENEFLERNPYAYSNYRGPDSTEYVKYDTDSNVRDFSNVNESKIRLVLLNDLNLKILPVEIANIDSLEDLSLSVNPEMDLQVSFSMIENPLALKHLSLVNSNLESLPKELLLFSNLERLYIGGNPKLDSKETIELLQNLKNLKVLWIQDNEWESLPNSIGNFKSLNLLYAKSNNFSDLPETMNNLDSLKKIFIYDNPVAKNYTDFIDTTKVKVFADR